MAPLSPSSGLKRPRSQSSPETECSCAPPGDANSSGVSVGEALPTRRGRKRWKSIFLKGIEYKPGMDVAVLGAEDAETTDVWFAIIQQIYQAGGEIELTLQWYYRPDTLPPVSTALRRARKFSKNGELVLSDHADSGQPAVSLVYPIRIVQDEDGLDADPDFDERLFLVRHQYRVATKHVSLVNSDFFDKRIPPQREPTSISSCPKCRSKRRRRVDSDSESSNERESIPESQPMAVSSTEQAKTRQLTSDVQVPTREAVPKDIDSKPRPRRGVSVSPAPTSREPESSPVSARQVVSRQKKVAPPSKPVGAGSSGKVHSSQAVTERTAGSTATPSRAATVETRNQRPNKDASTILTKGVTYTGKVTQRQHTVSAGDQLTQKFSNSPNVEAPKGHATKPSVNPKNEIAQSVKEKTAGNSPRLLGSGGGRTIADPQLATEKSNTTAKEGSSARDGLGALISNVKRLKSKEATRQSATTKTAPKRSLKPNEKPIIRQTQPVRRSATEAPFMIGRLRPAGLAEPAVIEIPRDTENEQGSYRPSKIRFDLRKNEVFIVERLEYGDIDGGPSDQDKELTMERKRYLRTVGEHESYSDRNSSRRPQLPSYAPSDAGAPGIDGVPNFVKSPALSSAHSTQLSSGHGRDSFSAQTPHIETQSLPSTLHRPEGGAGMQIPSAIVDRAASRQKGQPVVAAQRKVSSTKPLEFHPSRGEQPRVQSSAMPLDEQARTTQQKYSHQNQSLGPPRNVFQPRPAMPHAPPQASYGAHGATTQPPQGPIPSLAQHPHRQTRPERQTAHEGYRGTAQLAQAPRNMAQGIPKTSPSSSSYVQPNRLPHQTAQGPRSIDQQHSRMGHFAPNQQATGQHPSLPGQPMEQYATGIHRNVIAGAATQQYQPPPRMVLQSAPKQVMNTAQPAPGQPYAVAHVMNERMQTMSLPSALLPSFQTTAQHRHGEWSRTVRTAPTTGPLLSSTQSTGIHRSEQQGGINLSVSTKAQAVNRSEDPLRPGVGGHFRPIASTYPQVKSGPFAQDPRRPDIHLAAQASRQQNPVNSNTGLDSLVGNPASAAPVGQHNIYGQRVPGGLYRPVRAVDGPHAHVGPTQHRAEPLTVPRVPLNTKRGNAPSTAATLPPPPQQHGPAAYQPDDQASDPDPFL